jgi:hypothetical protein
MVVGVRDTLNSCFNKFDGIWAVYLFVGHGELLSKQDKTQVYYFGPRMGTTLRINEKAPVGALKS